MKDDASGKPISEFLGLRRKMFSFEMVSKKADGTLETVVKHRAKGVQRARVARLLESYSCRFSSAFFAAASGSDLFRAASSSSNFFFFAAGSSGFFFVSSFVVFVPASSCFFTSSPLFSAGGASLSFFDASPSLLTSVFLSPSLGGSGFLSPSLDAYPVVVVFGAAEWSEQVRHARDISTHLGGALHHPHQKANDHQPHHGGTQPAQIEVIVVASYTVEADPIVPLDYPPCR